MNWVLKCISQSRSIRTLGNEDFIPTLELTEPKTEQTA